MDHILANIPEELAATTPFRFVSVNISMHSSELELELLLKQTTSTNKFRKISRDGVHIIRASLSQNDSIFPNRNLQDAANCVTAFSFLKMFQIDDWTPIVLDVILKYGDRLYTRSVYSIYSKLGPLSDVGDADKLSLNQIISSFILSKAKFDVTVVNTIWEGPLTNLVDELYVFLNASCENKGVLVMGTDMVCVWKMDEYYYLFDPHETGPEGQRILNGVACLMRFNDCEKLVELISSNLKTDKIASNKVQLVDVRVSMSDVPPVNGVSMAVEENIFDVNSPSLAYLGCDVMKILHGKLNELSPELRWSNAKPTACFMVAAIAMSCYLDSEFWTSNTVDQVCNKVGEN